VPMAPTSRDGWYLVRSTVRRIFMKTSNFCAYRLVAIVEHNILKEVGNLISMNGDPNAVY